MIDRAFQEIVLGPFARKFRFPVRLERFHFSLQLPSIGCELSSETVEELILVFTCLKELNSSLKRMIYGKPLTVVTPMGLQMSVWTPPLTSPARGSDRLPKYPCILGYLPSWQH